MKRILLIAGALAAASCASCARHPATDAELAAEAQHAVDGKLDAQGQFSLMESVASQGIACGHVTAAGVAGRGNVDQDFVYQKGRLIMDDDADFDGAAIACDLAAGGGNAADASNVADS